MNGILVPAPCENEDVDETPDTVLTTTEAPTKVEEVSESEASEKDECQGGFSTVGRLPAYWIRVQITGASIVSDQNGLDQWDCRPSSLWRRK